MASAINCETDAKLVFSNWRDENGALINLTLIDALRVSVFDVESATFIRKSENFLESPDVELGTTGKLTLYLRPFDTRMIGDTEPGDSQSRNAYVRIAWDAERSDDITNPFSTTSASRTIAVHHASHGLAVGDSVFFETDTNVGGLDLGTQFAVISVVDSDHYTVEAHEPATSTVSASGGSVKAWIKGRAASANKTFAVFRNEPL